ncbi:MAG: hypothetical protein H0W45_07920 [Acidobacteria bacterium]|nr:hypothetical protein [Acidobacteriota bacterium]
MLKRNFLDEDGLCRRLEILRLLAKSIALEIDRIVGSEKENSSAENDGELQINFVEQIKKFEMDLIRFALFKSGGKQTNAARFLNMKLSTLNTRIKKYRISVAAFKSETPKPKAESEYNALR